MPGLRKSVKILLAFVLACATLQAAKPEWLVAKSAHFELYTTAGVGRARSVLRHFETVHGFFGNLLGGSGTGRKVRIVVFSNEKEFARFKPNEVAAAYYWPGPEMDWIVMGSAGEEAYPVAIHEYVHLLNHAGNGSLPLWLDEGLAEVYSTLRPQANKVLVGDLKQGRMETIRQNKWVPIADILAADHESPLYNKKEHAGMLYSEAWLLTHMMLMEADWQPKFPAFVRAVMGGMGSVEAIQKVFGQNARSLDQELQGYMRSDSFRAALFDYKLEKSRETVETAPASDYDWRLVVAELLRNENEAVGQLQDLRSRYADRPEAPAALGYRMWKSGKTDEARKLFGEAAERGSRNPRLLWDFARMAAGESEADAVKALDRLLALEPERVDARVLLARLHLRGNRTADASRALKPVKNVNPDQAPELFEMIAHIALREGANDEAIKALKRVIDLPVKEELKRNARKLLESVERRSRVEPVQRAAVRTEGDNADAVRPPPAPDHPERKIRSDMSTVEGKFRQLMCVGGKAWVILDVGGKKLTFLIDAPSLVLVKGRESGTLDLSCGPQNGAVVKLGYVEEGKQAQDVDGFVRVMDWTSPGR